MSLYWILREGAKVTFGEGPAETVPDGAEVVDAETWNAELAAVRAQSGA